MKAVSMEKAKALLIVTLLVTILVAEAGREMTPKEGEFYHPDWFWGPWWWWWGLHPWLGLKDGAPYGYTGKGHMPYDNNKGNGNSYGYGSGTGNGDDNGKGNGYGYGYGSGTGNGDGGKGDTPDHGGDGSKHP